MPRTPRRNYINGESERKDNSEWIGVADAAKIINRTANGVRKHAEMGNIRTQQTVKKFRVLWLYNRTDCETLAPKLGPRKYKKESKAAPILEKSTGYIKIYMPRHHLAMMDGYVYQHRLVAEKKIGRRLRVGEVVHHINGVRGDNRPSNLGVVGSIGEHISQHHAERNESGKTCIECGYEKTIAFRFNPLKPNEVVHLCRACKRARGGQAA